jgi:mono/diheme cytochrome c family protein
MRHAILFCALFFVVLAASAHAKPATDQPQLPSTYVPSGKQMFKQYCAACHGADGKGRGPATDLLKIPPPDLTTLAKRHEGKFPYDYVSSVLLFGPGFSAHGSADMPTWGALFQYLDKYNQAAVLKRIKNLCDYLASLQEK